MRTGTLSAHPHALTLAPQPGALYLTQELHFRGAATVGTPLRASITATRVGARYAVFRTCCTADDDGRVLVDGQATAQLPRVGPAADRQREA